MAFITVTLVNIRPPCKLKFPSSQVWKLFQRFWRFFKNKKHPETKETNKLDCWCNRNFYFWKIPTYAAQRPQKAICSWLTAPQQNNTTVLFPPTLSNESYSVTKRIFHTENRQEVSRIRNSIPGNNICTVLGLRPIGEISFSCKGNEGESPP